MPSIISPPKRQKIIDEILRSIQDGQLQPGTRLASIRSMASSFGVSTAVVQNAMRQLTDSMFVECRGTGGFYVTEHSAEVQPARKTPSRKPLYLVCVHHNDLVWRRSYEEYAEIQEKQIRQCLQLSGNHPEFCWGIEQAVILRNYLKRHPEDLKNLKKLFLDGKFEPTGGYSIPDLNMISGESIVRNLLAGKKYYRDILDAKTEVACLTDAFGMSAQIPQILRKCNYRYLIPGHLINCTEEVPLDGPFDWEGPDGSSVIVTARQSCFITHFEKFGNVPLLKKTSAVISDYIAHCREFKDDTLLIYTTEEFLFCEELFRILESSNRTPGHRIEFGRAVDYFRMTEEDEKPVYRGEFNPSCTGCYTTRIGVKQAARLAETKLFKIEFLNLCAQTPVSTEKAWEEIFLAEFHDGICGCHTDKADTEVMEKFAAAGNLSRPEPEMTGNKEFFSVCGFSPQMEKQLVFSPFAPKGIPVQKCGSRFCFTAELRPCGFTGFRKNGKMGPEPKRCPARFSTLSFDADFSSPHPMILNKERKNVFGADGFGEILMRPDYGTMWVEYHPGPTVYVGRECQLEKVVSLTEGAVFFEAVTEGKVLPRKPDCGNLGNHWPGFESLEFRKVYRFYKELDYFTLDLHLDWKGFNTRIAVRFPTRIDPDESHAVYEIPFGTLERAPYWEVPPEGEKKLHGLYAYGSPQAGGNWPALNFVDYSDGEGALAVANTGTPGHHIAGRDITISLIRSGTATRDGYMVPQPGSFDNGIHDFRFAFRAHAPSELEKGASLGFLLNRTPEVFDGEAVRGSLFSWDRPNVALSSARLVPGGIELRVYELLGRSVSAAFASAFNGDWIETDMEGNPRGMLDPAKISFQPFEIKTIFIKTSLTPKRGRSK